MCAQLLKADAGDDESALTAIQCLRSMNAILYACSTLPQLYPDLEQVAAVRSFVARPAPALSCPALPCPALPYPALLSCTSRL
jgi:hypothetical protein